MGGGFFKKCADFRTFEKCAFFNKSPAHLQKLMFTGTVNFDFRTFEECAFFKKSPAHFQKLMFTGTVNFDFRMFESQNSQCL